VWTVNPDIFESDNEAKSCPVANWTINQYGGTTYRPGFSRVNPDTIGCVWTGEFDLNTLRVDGEIFESGKETVADSKIFGYVWTGPQLQLTQTSSTWSSVLKCEMISHNHHNPGNGRKDFFLRFSSCYRKLMSALKRELSYLTTATVSGDSFLSTT